MAEERHIPVSIGVAEITQSYTYARPELMGGYQESRVYLFVKRAMDIVLSLIGIFILSPLLLAVALAIYIDDPAGSPLFIQERIGKDGKAFWFFKFRSMVVNAEALLYGLQSQNEMDGPVFKIKNDPRVTNVGRLIRKTSIDELPQLFNILKGDMSLVGPRPPLPREVEQYGSYER